MRICFEKILKILFLLGENYPVTLSPLSGNRSEELQLHTFVCGCER